MWGRPGGPLDRARAVGLPGADSGPGAEITCPGHPGMWASSQVGPRPLGHQSRGGRGGPWNPGPCLVCAGGGPADPSPHCSLSSAATCWPCVLGSSPSRLASFCFSAHSSSLPPAPPPHSPSSLLPLSPPPSSLLSSLLSPLLPPLFPPSLSSPSFPSPPPPLLLPLPPPSALLLSSPPPPSQSLFFLLPPPLLPSLCSPHSFTWVFQSFRGPASLPEPVSPQGRSYSGRCRPGMWGAPGLPNNRWAADGGVWPALGSAPVASSMYLPPWCGGHGTLPAPQAQRAGRLPDRRLPGRHPEAGGAGRGPARRCRRPPRGPWRTCWPASGHARPVQCTGRGPPGARWSGPRLLRHGAQCGRGPGSSGPPRAAAPLPPASVGREWVPRAPPLPGPQATACAGPEPGKVVRNHEALGLVGCASLCCPTVTSR